MVNTVYLSKDEFESMIKNETVKEACKGYTAAPNIVRKEHREDDSNLPRVFVYHDTLYVESEGL